MEPEVTGIKCTKKEGSTAYRRRDIIRKELGESSHELNRLDGKVSELLTEDPASVNSLMGNTYDTIGSIASVEPNKEIKGKSCLRHRTDNVRMNTFRVEKHCRANSNSKRNKLP